MNSERPLVTNPMSSMIARACLASGTKSSVSVFGIAILEGFQIVQISPAKADEFRNSEKHQWASLSALLTGGVRPATESIRATI